MKNKFSELAGYPPDDASDIGIRIRVLAGEIYSIQNAVDWLKRQSFAQTATGEQLEMLAAERGLSRKKAVAATGTLTFGVSSALWFSATIPAGTVCSTSGSAPVRYVTTEAVTLPQGSLKVDAPAKAETAGSMGNMPMGTVTVLVTPPSSIQTVVNAAAFTGGEDNESDDFLRARLLACYAEPPNGCNASWYRQAALQTDGVDSVRVVPRPNGAGTVALYLGGKGCAPSASTVQQVKDRLGALREIDVDLTVEAAQAVPVNVTAAVVAAPAAVAADVKTACTAAVQDYFLGLGVGEPVTLAGIGAKLYGTGMITDYSFTTEGTSMTDSQLAVLGTTLIMVL